MLRYHTYGAPKIYQNDREGDSFKMHQPIIIDFDIETGGRKNLAVGIVILKQ